MAKYGHRGIVNTDQGLRCFCPSKTCLDGWDQDRIHRHVNETKIHHDWEALREKEGVHQEFLSGFQADEADEESARTQLVGTRKSSLHPGDVAFSKDTVKQFLINGIPLGKLRKGSLRPFLQKITKMKLSNYKYLNQYIPELLKDEEKLQCQMLRDVKVSIIHDATPRQGDLFGLLLRYVILDPQTRRATANHTLIHVSTISGSLNQFSLNAEVSSTMLYIVYDL